MSTTDGVHRGNIHAYDDYTRLAGPLTDPGPGPYQVQFRNLIARDGRRRHAYPLLAAAIVFEITFLTWLLQPAHHPTDMVGWARYVSFALIAAVGLIEVLRLINVTTLVRATLNAADPVPVVPESGHRLAFLTTIVPGKEPVEMAEKTLVAAKAVDYDGVLDIWLLDEGDDPEVREMCARIGVNHFTRKGVEEYNQVSGKHKRKTKHGNYNAWFVEHGDDYDFWVSVDTDHVPHPDFARRLMGYFRDPDVAFVVGPQVYGQNHDNFVTKASESQQYLFHSVLQRAGNRWTSPMFVGTNNAVRLSALREIDGLADSITEDAATSLVWHTRENSRTGNRWKSVYTPDVLAVGEGPGNWSDYFTQQNRWARGTNEVMVRSFHKFAAKLSWGRRLHYLFLMSYYPSAALSWILGNVNVAIYLWTGTGGVRVAANIWLMLYLNAAVMQVGIYFWNRRYNVSPHEEEGSSGILGMFVSILSAPMYVVALIDAVRAKNVPFAVTPKGSGAVGDTVAVFRMNIAWGALIGISLAASFVLGNDHPAMQFWGWLAFSICFTPVAIWKATEWRRRALARRAERRIPHQRATDLPGLVVPLDVDHQPDTLAVLEASK